MWENHIPRIWEVAMCNFVFHHNIQILTGAEVSTEKIMPRSCVMLPEGQRPEGNIAQLRGIIFQC